MVVFPRAATVINVMILMVSGTSTMFVVDCQSKDRNGSCSECQSPINLQSHRQLADNSHSMRLCNTRVVSFRMLTPAHAKAVLLKQTQIRMLQCCACKLADVPCGESLQKWVRVGIARSHSRVQSACLAEQHLGKDHAACSELCCCPSLLSGCGIMLTGPLRIILCTPARLLLAVTESHDYTLSLDWRDAVLSESRRVSNKHMHVAAKLLCLTRELQYSCLKRRHCTLSASLSGKPRSIKKHVGFATGL